MIKENGPSIAHFITVAKTFFGYWIASQFRKSQHCLAASTSGNLSRLFNIDAN